MISAQASLTYIVRSLTDLSATLITAQTVLPYSCSSISPAKNKENGRWPLFVHPLTTAANKSVSISWPPPTGQGLNGKPRYSEKHCFPPFSSTRVHSRCQEPTPRARNLSLTHSTPRPASRPSPATRRERDHRGCSAVCPRRQQMPSNSAASASDPVRVLTGIPGARKPDRRGSGPDVTPKREAARTCPHGATADGSTVLNAPEHSGRRRRPLSAFRELAVRSLARNRGHHRRAKGPLPSLLNGSQPQAALHAL